MCFLKTVYLLFCLTAIMVLYVRMCQCIDEEFNPCDEKFKIVSDYSYKDCRNGYIFKSSGNSVYNCFSSCVPYDIQKPCSDTNPCPPGYLCPNVAGTESFCEIDENSCLKQHLEPDNPWKNAWKPTCLPDGSWAAKQCKGEAKHGRCFCYDTFGNRIFGQAFLDKSSNMTCACSRKKVEIRSKGDRFYTTLHCDPVGNYEPLQCDHGQCWCAESKTGKMISKVVPDSMMSLLPCYSKKEHGAMYMRPCESEEYAQKKILYELNLHGTRQINFPHIMCDDDGNYGYYQIVSGQAYCKWRDNSVIEGFAAAIDENLPNLNCYCARDTKIYESIGSTQYLLCLPTGNYKPDQYHIINEQWYCVDKDGFKSNEIPCSDTNPCPPGYLCPSSTRTDRICEIDKNSCLNQKLKLDNDLEYVWKPTCLPDGSWPAKHCKGEKNNGRCFCYDTLGNRIFGQAFADKSSNMTCACSRKKVEIRSQGDRFYTTLHCDSVGNYEPLQCDDGQCWCAEPKTGKMISKVVPDTMMSLLPCYSEEEHGKTYMRPCESEEYAQKKILYEFNLHGTPQINFPHIMCDDDGNYGYYQIVSAQAYCKWIDNSVIEGYAASIDGNLANLNCYCARDHKIYESIGLNQNLLCLSTGNYKPEQYHAINEQWYCVDKDGFKSSEFFNEPTDCTPYTK
ncbi:hypothetical protein RN001_001273 [Aquatica leii]|uniref:Thyroglobulin type-1 domain-containing protein n=1 Tax=Aquatica leii TaxID=1421715 RepID=A0AAN7SJI1_9COLE|nr:hypothetical protein RN001_001273 [Aquatica leii]